MITVKKSIYRWPDGRCEVEKLAFQVSSPEALEAKRKRDSRNLGCESIRYVYQETGGEDEIDETEEGGEI